MMKDDLQEGCTTATLSEEDLINFEGKSSFQEGFFSRRFYHVSLN